MPEAEQLLEALGELKAELKAQSLTLAQVLAQAKRTNGRVDMLEEWRRTVEIRQAHAEGLAEGVETAAITKGQLRAILAGMGVVASLSGTIAGLIVKVAG